MFDNNILDYERMFKHACAFFDCAKYCEIEPNNIEYRMMSHNVANIVNSVFACEVFIKSLLSFHGISGNKLKGHELKELWNKLRILDSKNTSLIEKSIKSWFNSENENLFDELLDSVSNAFEYGRYIYEKDNWNINPNFLRGFRNILREFCCNQFYKKSWFDYIKNDQKCEG